MSSGKHSTNIKTERKWYIMINEIYNDEMYTNNVKEDSVVSLNRSLIDTICSLNKLPRVLFEMLLASINPKCGDNQPTAKVKYSTSFFRKFYKKGVSNQEIKDALFELSQITYERKNIFYRCYMTPDDNFIVLDLHYKVKDLFFNITNYVSYAISDTMQLTGKSYDLFVYLKSKYHHINPVIKAEYDDMLKLLDIKNDAKPRRVNQALGHLLKKINEYTRLSVDINNAFDKFKLPIEFRLKYDKNNMPQSEREALYNEYQIISVDNTDDFIIRVIQRFVGLEIADASFISFIILKCELSDEQILKLLYNNTNKDCAYILNYIYNHYIKKNK